MKRMANLKRILFVDDENQVLKAIRRIFMDSAYNIQCCESAEEALEIMSNMPIDMIITDMKMPGMNGTELLKITKQKYPKIIRLILSGYSDEQEVMYILRINLAKAYMFKPWSNDELLRIVSENLDEKEVQLPKEIIDYINNLDRLPTTGARYQHIHDAVQESKDIAAISAVIEKDQALTAKILQIVNSAYYGIKTGSVQKALSFIGTNELQNLLMSMDIMACLSVTGDGCDIAEFMWDQAYYTSKIQQIVQEHFQHKKRKHYDTAAGLLHKIGTVLMIKYYKKSYISLLRKAMETGDCDLLAKEQDAYGFSHPMLSAYLLRWWNAPEQIVEAAAYYHSPLSEGVNNKELVSIIHIAQHYASAYLNAKPFISMQPDTFGILGLNRTEFEEKYKTLILD